MTQISALELRQNLRDIFERAQKGEQFSISYRGQSSLTLGLKQSKTSPRRSMQRALQAIEKAQVPPHFQDPKVSVKELYHEQLAEKYGRRS